MKKIWDYWGYFSLAAMVTLVIYAAATDSLPEWDTSWIAAVLQ
jgi:hypothetical protein